MLLTKISKSVSNFFIGAVLSLSLPLLTCIPAKSEGKIANIENEAGSILVTDCAGRKVFVPEKIERIGCLYAFTGHVVTMLGKGKNIVAVANGLKRDSLLHLICPSILDALVPKSQGSLNIEELLKANVDILFLPGDIARNSAEMAKLDRFKIPYLIIDYGSIKEQQNAIRVIAKAINAVEKADAFNAYYNECIVKVQLATGNIREDQRIRVYHSVNEATRTTINKGLSTDWLSVLNVINVASEINPRLFDGKNFVSLEQILLWDPDVILSNEPQVIKFIMTESQWSSLAAVKNKRVYQMPIGISRWGHPGSIETPLAILWSAKKLYPERLKDLDIVMETKMFYRRFFKYELSDNLLKRIFSGTEMRKPKKKRNLG